eukprot:INCI10170.1.p1 GENE.INCI10170.1~~INCI10170.1.p1  ORF type:complete len:332 (-),score=36.50 INCI10170.1:412-1407(-)
MKAIFQDKNAVVLLVGSMLLGMALFLVFSAPILGLVSAGIAQERGPSLLVVDHDGETAAPSAADVAAGLLAGGAQASEEPADVLPRYEIIHGVETVWTPTSSSPQGVALMLHGCSHAATDWFPRSAGCKYCGFGKGGWALPEEKKVVTLAQERNLAVVVMSSDDRTGSKCWSPRKDVPKVSRALDALLTRPENTIHLADLPIYVFGASSGGSFASLLPANMLRPDGSRFNFAGIAVQISGGGGLKSALSNPEAARIIPPIAFLHMPKDMRTAKSVTSLKAQLHKAGTPVMVVGRSASAITDVFFSDRIDEVRLWSLFGGGGVGRLFFCFLS